MSSAESSPPGLTSLLLEAGHALLEQSKWDGARRSAEEALRRARESGAIDDEANALFLLGKAALGGGDRAQAHEAWTACLEIQLVRPGAAMAAARTCCELGILHRVSGRLEDARTVLRQSLRLSSESMPGDVRARALEQLGTVERRAGEIDQAVEFLSESLRIYEALGDVGAAAGAREKLGNCLQNLGRLEEARGHYEICAQVFTEAHDLPRLAATLNNLAGTLHAQGRHREAVDQFQRARALFQEMGKKKPLAVTLGNLGVLALQLGHAEEARSLLEESLALLEELGEPLPQASVLNNLALLHLVSGRCEEAVALADRAVALQERLGLGEGICKPLLNKARALLALGRTAEAGALQRRVEEDSRQGGDVGSRAEALLLEAELHLAAGSFEPARASARAALELTAEAHPREEAHALHLLGSVELRRGELEAARDLLVQAESRYRRFADPYRTGLCALELGTLFLRVEAYEAAAQRLREARGIFRGFGNEPEEWNAMIRLIEAEHAVSEEQGVELMQEARAWARARGGRDREGELESLARRLAAEGTREAEVVAQLRDLEPALLVATQDEAVARVTEFLRRARGVSWVRWIASPLAPSFGDEASAALGGGTDATACREAIERALSRDEFASLAGPGWQLFAAPVRTRPPSALALVARSGGGGLRFRLEGAALLLGAALRGPGVAGSQGPAPAAVSGLSEAASYRGILAASRPMRRIFRTIEQVAPSSASVLIEGESGTGKELVARAIHEASGRPGAFVAINCPSFPEGLIESELFGHEKGAFTGAGQRRGGQVELAHRGTLFLDEIGDMSMATQTKLLRFLEQREFLRVGGREPVRVDVRLIAATSRDLAAELAAGRFREDLYHRIKVVPLRLPPLRDRRDDVPVLARAFLAELAPGVELSPSAVAVLQEQPWPGNVRELKNLVHRVAATGVGPMVDVEALPEEYRSRRAGTAGSAADASPGTGELRAGETLQARLLTVEGMLLRATLERSQWNQSRAALRLGLSESTLRDKMARFGIRRPESTRRSGRRPRRTGPSQNGPRQEAP